MRKYTVIACSLCMLTISATGCLGNTKTGDLNGHPLDGNWVGIGNAIGYGTDYNIDMTQMIITSDGGITFDDSSENTKDLSGVINVDEDDSFTISATEDPAKLDLPTGWDDLEEEDDISYELLSDTQMVLTYDDISYFFKKKPDGETETPSTSPLYELGENNVWYSSGGTTGSDTSYELHLYDQYMELYSNSPTKGRALVTSFFGLSNDGSSFTFYTDIIPGREIPDVLSSLPEGLSTVTFDIKCEDDTLTLSLDQQSLVFSNKAAN